MSILKSIGAVLAGFVSVVIVSVGVDALLEGIGFFPPANQPEAYVWWMLLIALAYRTVITIGAGYITAKLAPSRPMRHAIILGIVGTIGGTLGVIASWDLGSHWYPILLAVLALPSTWWGGRLLETRRIRRAL